MRGAREEDVERLLGRGQEAIESGDWSTAREVFEEVLRRDEPAEASFGLGVALWWLGETEASVRHHESAYAAFRRRPDPPQALFAAFWLGLTHLMSLGNNAASQGWLGRATSLVEEFDLGPLAGWALVMRAYLATDTGRPEEGERHAREAQRIARESGDADLNLCAMSEVGAALVERGRVEEGTALLDEAMAGALAGEGGGLDTIVLISCRTITSCSRGGDLARATQWVKVADDFHQRYGSLHLYTRCRTAYGQILFATGDWEDAERELLSALQIGKRAEPALHVEALATLARLRLAQGRPEEAARLLAGHEGDPAAVPAVATLRLARGEHEVASSILRRRLRELDERSLTGAELLELLVDAEIAGGAGAGALTDAERLTEIGSGLGSEQIVARGERARGRALIAGADHETASSHLERSLAAFERLGMPLDAGRTRLLLARSLADRERATAIAEAQTALASLDAIGAARDADEAAGFLRGLGVRAARAGPRGLGLLTKRELEILGLLAEGLSNPEIAERLFISRKTVEHHVASVLSKLGLGGRAEAAAFALRHLDPERGSATK